MGIKDRIKDYGWFVCTALNRTPLGIRNHPRATVVVIPGIYEGRTQLMPLARSLHEAGYQVEIIGELAMLTKPTAKLARIVAQRVATIPGPVVLLAHSKAAWLGQVFWNRMTNCSISQGWSPLLPRGRVHHWRSFSRQTHQCGAWHQMGWTLPSSNAKTVTCLGSILLFRAAIHMYLTVHIYLAPTIFG